MLKHVLSYVKLKIAVEWHTCCPDNLSKNDMSDKNTGFSIFWCPQMFGSVYCCNYCGRTCSFGIRENAWIWKWALAVWTQDGIFCKTRFITTQESFPYEITVYFTWKAQFKPCPDTGNALISVDRAITLYRQARGPLRSWSFALARGSPDKYEHMDINPFGRVRIARLLAEITNT